jgi:hypothetical protein
VVRDRLGCEVQPLRDRTVAQAGCDQIQDLALRPTQVGEGSRVIAVGEVLQHPSRHTEAEDRLTRDDTPKRSLELMLPGALEEVTVSAGAHRREHGLLVVEHRQHEDRRVRGGCPDPPGGLQAVGAGHTQVHEHDVAGHAVHGWIADDRQPAVFIHPVGYHPKDGG